MLTVITGPMFSGKSSRLITMGMANSIAGRKVLGFKPSNDTRYGRDIVSHNGVSFPAISINKDNPYKCIEYIKEEKPDVVLFDEVQFFDIEKFTSLILYIAIVNRYDVVCSGLTQDYMGNPFGATPNILAMADDIICLRAVCSKCKKLDTATRTYRKTKDKEQVVVGGSNMYEPRCFDCWSES